MPAREINWTFPALQDLDSLFEYIGRDAPVYAESYVQRIVDAVSRLEDLPHSGRKVAEAPQDDIREIIFEDYRIIYWIVSELRVDVLGIVHGSRDLRQVRNQPW